MSMLKMILDAFRAYRSHLQQEKRLRELFPSSARQLVLLPPGLDAESERAIIEMQRRKYGDDLIVFRAVGDGDW